MDAFFSCSQKDKKFAYGVHDKLRSKGFDIWSYRGQISTDWLTEMKTGIQISNNFILIVSPNSMGEVACNLAVAYAIELKKRIIPIYCVEVDILKILERIGQSELDMVDKDLLKNQDFTSIVKQNWRVLDRIASIHLSEISDFEACCNLLIETMQTDIKYLHQHREYLQSAYDWQRYGETEDSLLMGQRLQDAILWLAIEVKTTPFPTDLHRRYILESQRVASLSNRSWQKRIQKHFGPIFQRTPQKLFLSYRRSDTSDACGRIYDRLSLAFGNKNVFYDQASIEFGEDFRDRIELAITECFAMLVIIGPQWEQLMIERGQDAEPDYVKIEVEIALRRKHVTVIPILVGGATMPDRRNLPDSLTALLNHNAAPIRSGREFNDDISELIKGLRKIRSQPNKNGQ